MKADVLYKRAIYSAVQRQLGWVDPANFLANFRYPILDMSQADKEALTAEYEAYSQNPDFRISDLLRGTIEENTGNLRIKRALSERG